jgi:hemerythrin superfamily protein
MSDKVSDVIKNDHRELENYYNKIMDSKDADTRTRYQNQFTWELARHSIAEELVVYPAMEKYILEDGKELAEKDRKEHRTVSCYCSDPTQRHLH